ncbi:MAG: hypothetical protein RIM23_09980 [Coleofasciculus sp. G3-WIS-01]|uniref:hypothetical protein n=1 Tax=Coleofasciculus sp. G3-WIS-01 TaxID=3069528 RepID=UPI0032FB27B8
MPIFYGPSSYFADHEFVPLALDLTNPFQPIATYPEGRNLLKVQIESLSITEPGTGNQLTEAAVDIEFPAIADGDEGLIKITNLPGTTGLNLNGFKQSKLTVGDFEVNKVGTTLLRFSYTDGVFFFSTISEAPRSATENRKIELNVRITGSDEFGSLTNDFKTPNGALRWVTKYAPYTSDEIAFSTDSPIDSVTIRIHCPESGEAFVSSLHLPDLPPIGIRLLGIPNSFGQQPIIDSSTVITQFNRGLYSRNSQYITVENVHFRHNRMIVVVTRNSRLLMVNCTLELLASVSAVILVRESSLHIAGRLYLISPFPQQTFCDVSGAGGSIRFYQTVGTSTSNKNVGLSIEAEPIQFDRILSANSFSEIIISDYLDGNSAGKERYLKGTLYSSNPTNSIGFSSRIINNSTKFP